MRYKTIFIYFFVSVLPVCMALMDHSFMVFCRQSRTLYVVSSTLFHDTCTVDDGFWYEYFCLSFFECCDNLIHWMGFNKSASAVKPENINYPDPSTYNNTMVYKRYGFYVQQWQARFDGGIISCSYSK